MKKPRNESLLKALAAEIKSLRTGLGVSQEEIAHRAGLNRTFVGKLEVAQTQPSFTVLFQLADALEVDAAALVANIAKRTKKELSSRHHR
jgi:transcriptional regulator with XRE-family HTH domain